MRLARKAIHQKESIENTVIDWGNSKVVEKSTRRGLAFFKGGQITFSGELPDFSQTQLAYSNLLNAA